MLVTIYCFISRDTFFSFLLKFCTKSDPRDFYELDSYEEKDVYMACLYFTLHFVNVNIYVMHILCLIKSKAVFIFSRDYFEQYAR